MVTDTAVRRIAPWLLLGSVLAGIATGMALGLAGAAASVGGAPLRPARMLTLRACFTPDVRVTLGAVGVVAGMQYGQINFENQGTRRCTLSGYPRAWWIDGSGRRVGHQARRSNPWDQPGKVATLAPGQIATATIGQPNPSNFPPKACAMSRTVALRIYPPGLRTHTDIPRAMSVCTSQQGRPFMSAVRAALPSLEPTVTAAYLRPGYGVVAMANTGSAPHYLLEVTTDFVHWRDISPPPPPPSQYGDDYRLSSISFPTALDGWVVARTGGNLVLYRTTDGGSTWQDLGATGQGGAAGEELIGFSDALHGWREVVAATAGRVLASLTADGGRTWNPIATPGSWPASGLLAFSTPQHGFSADTLPPQPGLVTDQPIAAFSPLWETTDGGADWSKAAIRLPPERPSASSYEALPTFFNGTIGVLPVALFGSGPAVAFYTSSDGGSVWSFAGSAATSAVEGPSGSVGQWPSAAAASPSTWWVISGDLLGTAPIVRVTADAGRTWTVVTSTGLPADIEWVQAASATVAWAMTTTVGPPDGGCTMYGTSDGGMAWRPVCPGT